MNPIRKLVATLGWGGRSRPEGDSTNAEYPAPYGRGTTALYAAAPAPTAKEAAKPATTSLLMRMERETTLEIKAQLNDLDAAIRATQNLTMPRRDRLVAVYENLLLDSHLHSVAQTRVLQVLAQKWRLVDVGGQDAPPEVLALLDTDWFLDILRHALEAQYWGHSLVELIPTKTGLWQAHLVPRRYVVPELGVVLRNRSDTEGIPYRQPPIDKWVFEFWGEEPLGLLRKAAVPVILKKNMLSAWSEFADKFGIPMRVAVSNTRSEQEKQELDSFLRDMGRSGWARLPEGTTFEIKESTRSDAHAVFKEGIELLNRELSKLIGGQTMTADEGGSLAQAKVHESILADYRWADKRHLETVVNNQVLPKLAALGLGRLTGYRFMFDDSEELSLTQHWQVVQGLLAHYDIEPEWIEGRFGVPVVARAAMPAPTPPTNPEPDADDDGVDDGDDPEPPGEPSGLGLGQPRARASSAGRTQHCGCGGAHPEASGFDPSAVTAQEQRLLEAVFVEGIDYDRRLTDATVQVLVRGLERGFESVYGVASEYGKPDALRLFYLKANLWRFSAAKTREALMQLNQLVKGAETFADFEAAVRKDKTFEKYNRAYLRAEYNHTVAASQSAASWQRNRQMMAYGYSHLRYQTMADGNVRAAHQALDGITLPQEHPYWAEIHPPNGWGCRCIVQPVLASQREAYMPDEQSARAVGRYVKTDEWAKAKKAGFATNFGATNQIFTEAQQYLKAKQLGNLGYKQNGLPPFAELQTVGPSIEAELALYRQSWDKQRAMDWFNSRARDGVVSLAGWQGVPIRLLRENFEKHITAEKAARYALRPAYVPFIERVLADPSEAFLQYSTGGFQDVVRYLKFFQGNVVSVTCKMRADGIELVSWDLLGPSSDHTINGNWRSGIPIHSTIKAE